jgi:lipid-binding SYLF domain-containing protein
MKRLTVATAAVLAATLSLAVGAENKELERKQLAADVKNAIQAFTNADSTLPNALKKAAGYAVFPSVAKGGLVVGAAHGDGEVYADAKLIGWAKLTQVTVGAQVGGQEYSQLILFETQQALEKFKESGFAMSAQVSAVAAAEGASGNAKYIDGVMVFTRARQGLMAEASIGGQKFHFEPVPQESK